MDLRLVVFATLWAAKQMLSSQGEEYYKIMKVK
jgi:hypothetical protein